MAALNKLYLLDSPDGYASGFGLLSETAPGSDAVTGTGWIVGTHVAADSILQYGVKQTAATFTGGTGTLPSTTVAPLPSGQCYRSQNPYTGTLLPGWWALSMVFQAVSAAGANCWLQSEIWKGSDPTGANAVQLFSQGQIDTHSAPIGSLAIGVSQQTNSLFPLDSFTNNYTAPQPFNNEFFFLQLALEISSAAGNAASDAMICTSPSSFILFPPFVPALSRLYFLQSMQTGKGNGKLTATPIPATETAMSTGATVGTLAANNYARMKFGTKLVVGAFSGTIEPAGPPNGSDCWAAADNALTGTFAAGDWILCLMLTGVTAANAQVQLRVRIWQSTSPDGSNATEITAGAAVTTNTSTGGGPSSYTGNGPLGTLAGHSQIPCFVSVALGAVTMLRAFVFVQIAYQTLASGGGATVDAMFVLGPGSYFATPPFTPGNAGILGIGGAFPS